MYSYLNYHIRIVEMNRENLKIALICREASMAGGGVERYALSLSRELADMGHTVHIFANRWDENIDKRVRTHGVYIQSGLQSIKILSFIHNCRRLIEKSGSFDILCSLTQFYPQDVFRLGGSIWNVLMERMHPVRWKRFIKYLIADGYLLRLYLERKIFQEGNYRHVVAISNVVKRQLMDTYNIPEGDVTVIHNGVDLNRFNPHVKARWRNNLRSYFKFKDGDIILLFVGHDFRRKGLEYVIRVLPSIDKRVKLLVAGRDNSEGYKKTATSLSVEDRIVFAGPIKEMEKIYAASDIFVFPTLYDAFGSVGLEAMACGLPVITSGYSGFSELVENRSNGIVLDKLSTEDLAMAINSILKEDIRNYLAENGIKTARQFTIRKNAEEMLKVFYKITGYNYN